jgi:hypothetical protein
MKSDLVLEELEKLHTVHQVGQATFLWSRTSGCLLCLADRNHRQQMLGGFLHGVCTTARLSAAETATAAYVVGLLAGDNIDALSAARNTLGADQQDRFFQQGLDEAARIFEGGCRH